MRWADFCSREDYLRLRNIHKMMKRRCFRSDDKDYRNYGMKGISICDEWLQFRNFAHWALANGYADKLTIDRIDGNKGYCPDNCRWVTTSEQSINRNNNHIIMGKPIIEWAKQVCKSDEKLHSVHRRIIYRLSLGWTEYDAVFGSVQCHARGGNRGRTSDAA